MDVFVERQSESQFSEVRNYTVAEILCKEIFFRQSVIWQEIDYRTSNEIFLYEKVCCEACFDIDYFTFLCTSTL